MCIVFIVIATVSIPIMLTVTEDGDIVQVCSTITGDPSAIDSLNLTLATINGSATSGLDFVSERITFSVDSKNDGQCLNVIITDDTLLEANETFYVTLTVTSDSIASVATVNNMTRIIIRDNEGILIHYNNKAKNST